MSEVLGIARYKGWTEQGHQVYGIQGWGEDYNRFWKEFKYQTLWESDDFPWSYVSLSLEDEADLIAKWGDLSMTTMGIEREMRSKEVDSFIASFEDNKQLQQAMQDRRKQLEDWLVKGNFCQKFVKTILKREFEIDS